MSPQRRVHWVPLLAVTFVCTFEPSHAAGQVLQGGVTVDESKIPEIFASQDPLGGRLEVVQRGDDPPRCVPPDSRWRLIAQEGNRCYYYAPFAQRIPGTVVDLGQVRGLESVGGRCGPNPFDPRTAICQNLPASTPSAQASNAATQPGCPTVPGTTYYPEKIPPECRPPQPTRKTGPPMAAPMAVPNVPPAPPPTTSLPSTPPPATGPSRLAPPNERNKWTREGTQMVFTDSLGRSWSFDLIHEDVAMGRWKLDTASRRVISRPNQLWDALARYDLILTEPGSIPQDQWLFGKLLNR